VKLFVVPLVTLILSAGDPPEQADWQACIPVYTNTLDRQPYHYDFHFGDKRPGRDNT
jgi:hypothetical protein